MLPRVPVTLDLFLLSKSSSITTWPIAMDMAPDREELWCHHMSPRL
jgi:hypothetical protein